jgi:hypothetical protein
MWLVKRRDDLALIVPTLDQHPPRGRKAREYSVWRDAALLFASDKPRRVIQSRLPRLREQLADARRYTPP